jgi:L-ascorbate metabolism protein UlaG (beta-lactamase superfamily)
MKRIVFFLLIAALALAGCGKSGSSASAGKSPDVNAAAAKLHWFGTSAFLYNGSKVVYFDPISLDGSLPQADLILVTHAHNDHWSVADLQKIIGPKTVLVIGPNVSTSYAAAKADLGIPATVLSEGQATDVDGITVRAVPAYDTIGHGRDAGGVGFLVTLDGVTIYASGGTAAYPDMANFKVDIAMVPVYSKAQAEAMAKILPAKIIIFDHTSYYAAQALGTLFAKDMSDKQFLALETGPYTP